MREIEVELGRWRVRRESMQGLTYAKQGALLDTTSYNLYGDKVFGEDYGVEA